MLMRRRADGRTIGNSAGAAARTVWDGRRRLLQHQWHLGSCPQTTSECLGQDRLPDPAQHQAEIAAGRSVECLGQARLPQPAQHQAKVAAGHSVECLGQDRLPDPANTKLRS